jgi:hypothetical protein
LYVRPSLPPRCIIPALYHSCPARPPAPSPCIVPRLFFVFMRPGADRVYKKRRGVLRATCRLVQQGLSHLENILPLRHNASYCFCCFSIVLLTSKDPAQGWQPTESGCSECAIGLSTGACVTARKGSVRSIWGNRGSHKTETAAPASGRADTETLAGARRSRGGFPPGARFSPIGGRLPPFQLRKRLRACVRLRPLVRSEENGPLFGVLSGRGPGTVPPN